MSSIIQHLFEQKYNSWGKALGDYLDEKFGKRGSRSKLARMLLGDEADDVKVKSKASEVGRWINQGVTPIERTREEVHNLLNICISENNQGYWEISRTDDPTSNKIDQLEQKIADEGVDYNAQDQLLEYLEDRTESLSQELAEINLVMKRLRLAMKKNRSDD